MRVVILTLLITILCSCATYRQQDTSLYSSDWFSYYNDYSLWSQNVLYWQIQNDLKKVDNDFVEIAERVNSQLKDFNTNIENLLQNDTKLLLENDLYDFKLPSRNNFDYPLPNLLPEFDPPQINVNTGVRKDAKLFERHNFQDNIQPPSYNFDYPLPDYNFNYHPPNYNFDYQLP